LPDEAIEAVATQVGVPAAELGFYEWTGSTIEYHRAQIRAHLGFRECGVADADKLTARLAATVCERERRVELVRDELLAHCRMERIEPPTAGRVDRIVRSALRASEQTLTVRISSRLMPATIAGLEALISSDEDDADGEEGGRAPGLTLLARIKQEPGNVSLDTMLTEIDKLAAVRAVGLPVGLFEDVAPKMVEGRPALQSRRHRIYASTRNRCG